MKKYEVMYILRSDLDAEAIKKEVADVEAIFKNNGSEVLETKEWGFRDLAYEIKGNKKRQNADDPCYEAVKDKGVEYLLEVEQIHKGTCRDYDNQHHRMVPHGIRPCLKSRDF